jgi:hypothetical protein
MEPDAHQMMEIDFPAFKGKGKAKDDQPQDNENLPWCGLFVQGTSRADRLLKGREIQTSDIERRGVS